MTDQNQIQQLYADFCRFLRGAGSNGFYTFFQQAIRSFPSTLSVYEKYVERHVDLAWVEAIEKTIVPLDNIIRKPNSFIKREEDIIPIAQAHGIGPESVRHLAQHTSLISSVKKGRVTPARILNITKDDSLETYENRFIYTLIRQVSYFLDKRMTVLMKDAKEADQFDYHVNGNCDIGADKLTYNFSMHLETPHEEVDEEELINADISGMTPLQRVERLRKIFYTFQGSSLFQSLTGTPDVRPPLVMTNVLRKNPNFIVAVSLWNFILSYNQTGFTTEDVEQYRIPTENDKNELYALILLEYSMIKKQTNTIETMQDLETPTEQKLIAPNIVRRSIDDLCDTFDLTVDEVRKVYEKELKKKEKKRNSEFTKAQAVFERALQTEEENDRIDEIERNKRLLAEMLATLKAAMKDEEMLEKERRAAEEAARLAAEEAARLAEEAARQAEEEIEISDRGFIYRFRYSFEARLIQGGDPLQTYYTELKNYLLSYPNVKCKMAWGYERFYLGRKPIVKINGRGKGLNLFLALSPDLFDNTKYHVEDLRVEGKTTDYPSKFRVRSDRALKYAKELLAMRLTELGLVQGDLPTEDYHLPYRSREDLMALDPPLIKLSSTATPAEPSTNPIAIPASATPDEEDDRKMTAPTPIDPIDSLEEEPTAEPAPAEESTRRFSWKKMFARLFGKRNSENKKK